MLTEPRFFICTHCQSLVSAIVKPHATMFCCDSRMFELISLDCKKIPTTHTPSLQYHDHTLQVTIGLPIHTMTSTHSIQWIYLQTTMGGVRKHLFLQQLPTVSFPLYPGEEILGIYTYCSVHGLYKYILQKVLTS